MQVLLSLVATLPQEWPFWDWFTEAWVREEVYVPRFSYNTLSPGDMTVADGAVVGTRLLPYIRNRRHGWACSVPGGHASLGLDLEGQGLGLVAEPGLLSGRDAPGIPAWDMARTGVLPPGEISAGFVRLYGSFKTHGARFFLGKDRVSWSPLLLPGSPLDGGGLVYARGSFSFTYILAHLDDYIADSAAWFKEGWLEPGDRLRRFLIAKRIEWSLGEGFSLALAEASVYTTGYGFPPLGALNPVSSMYIYQWTNRDDNNSLWSISGAVRGHGIGLFWELLVDDLQFNPDYWDEAPADIGFFAKGIFCAGRAYFSGEAAGASAWAYNNTRDWDKYAYYGQCLGLPEGPGALRLVGEGGYHLGPWVDVGAGARLVERGSSSLQDPNPRTGDYPPGWLMVSPVSAQSFFYGKTSVVWGTAWLVAEAGAGSWPYAKASLGVMVPW